MENEKFIHFLRKRIGVSYEKAKEALTQSNNDIIEAIMQLKGKDAVVNEKVPVQGTDMKHRIMALLRESHVIRIGIVRNGRVVMVIPAWMGGASAVLFPLLTVLTWMALAYKDYTLIIDRVQFD